jgi:hypothetical protein
MHVILIDNGTVVNVINADSLTVAEQFYPKYTCVERTAGMVVGPGYTTTDNINFTPPAPNVTIDWKITNFAMLNRFTPTELVEINVARQEAGANGAQMEILWQNLSTAKFVDLKLPQLDDMVNNLVSVGILTSDRANTILNTVPSSSELIGGI